MNNDSNKLQAQKNEKSQLTCDLWVKFKINAGAI